MKLAYLLLVHTDPKQTSRLVRRLQTPHSVFFIHIDRNKSTVEFKRDLEGISGVHLLPDSDRVASIWGDFGIVQASLNLLRAAYALHDVEWFVLMSGQDYPLSCASSVSTFLRSNPNTAFIECRPAAQCWPTNSLRLRLEKYKFNLSEKRGDFVTIADCWSKQFYTGGSYSQLKAALRANSCREIMRVMRRRKFPFETDAIVGGSAWWALPRLIAGSLLDLIDSEPRINRYFGSSLLPDEIYFQNCLMHLTKANRDIKIRDSLTYVNWTKKQVSLPVTFTFADKDELDMARRTHLFARKFDSRTSSDVLDWLDTNSFHNSSLV